MRTSATIREAVWEGGRSSHGLRQFKEGAAYIAIKAGVPVVPMAVVGMRELLPMGSIHIKSGQVVLRVGDPIPTTGLTLSNRMEICHGYNQPRGQHPDRPGFEADRFHLVAPDYPGFGHSDWTAARDSSAAWRC